MRPLVPLVPIAALLGLAGWAAPASASHCGACNYPVVRRAARAVRLAPRPLPRSATRPSSRTGPACYRPVHRTVMKECRYTT